MKVGIMLNGMVQMLDWLEDDSEVIVSVKLPNGEIFEAPLKTVKSSSAHNNVILSTYES